MPLRHFASSFSGLWVQGSPLPPTAKVIKFRERRYAAEPNRPRLWYTNPHEGTARRDSHNRLDHLAAGPGCYPDARRAERCVRAEFPQGRRGSPRARLPDLTAHNPRIIYASASGYGPDGPDSG